MGLVEKRRDFLIARFCQISESWCLVHCNIGGLRSIFSGLASISQEIITIKSLVFSGFSRQTVFNLLQVIIFILSILGNNIYSYPSSTINNNIFKAEE
jgi:hypothetical protein